MFELLATAVSLNLEGAPMKLQEDLAKNPMVGAILGGIDPCHVLSTGLAATTSDSNGVPFNGSWVVATGNLVSDMYANVAAEASGRLLATRLWEMTDDPGMKDMLSFLIARDTMHQNQWLAVIEELEDALPIPDDFPQTQEKQEVSYTYFMQSNRVSNYSGRQPTPPAQHKTTCEAPQALGSYREIHIGTLTYISNRDPMNPFYTSHYEKRKLSAHT
jgi:Mn-containing catalase